MEAAEMKIKKAVALCVDRKRVVLYDQKTGGDSCVQWLSDDRAMYPLEGMPYITPETLCTMFDVPEKTAEKISFDHHYEMPGIDCSDVAPETMAERLNIDVVKDGVERIPLKTHRGVAMINAKYLGPLSDMRDMLEFYERSGPQGRPYIAVKAGLLVKAIIQPMLPDSITQDVVELAELLAVSAMEERGADESA
jgi:hypothetical protein